MTDMNLELDFGVWRVRRRGRGANLEIKRRGRREDRAREGQEERWKQSEDEVTREDRSGKTCLQNALHPLRERKEEEFDVVHKRPFCRFVSKQLVLLHVMFLCFSLCSKEPQQGKVSCFHGWCHTALSQSEANVSTFGAEQHRHVVNFPTRNF